MRGAHSFLEAAVILFDRSGTFGRGAVSTLSTVVLMGKNGASSISAHAPP